MVLHCFTAIRQTELTDWVRQFQNKNKERFSKKYGLKQIPAEEGIWCRHNLVIMYQYLTT
jgi:hypothetical protein